MKLIKDLACLALLTALPAVAQAETATASDDSTELGIESTSPEEKHADKKLSRITVTGSAEAARTVPGSAHILKGEELEEAKGGFDDIHRVLRRVPGVNIQEEEGYGLRPNIGLRGAPSERSEGITLMEDGVLIAPAPYSAPAAYYFPTTGRLEGIEVTKGPGQIKYGPRTTGGSLNLLSTSIPRDFKFDATLRGGEDDTLIGHVATGKNFTYGGFLLEAYQADTDGFKRLDGGGDTGYDLQDLVGKFRINTDPSSEYYQELELKLQTSDQDANETYLGLTRADFDRDPFRRYRGSALDRLNVEHDQVQLRHFGQLSENVDITTTFYNNETFRLWRKVDSVGGVGVADILDDPVEFADQYGWITGDDSAEGAFAIRNNRRRYRATGVQSVLGVTSDFGPVSSELEFGVRYHHDYEDRFQEDDKFTMQRGDLVLASLGSPGSNANRKGEADAWAFYLQDKLGFGDLTVTPGVRYEHINFKNRDWGRNDPRREGAELKTSHTSVDSIIPGVGAFYRLTDVFGVFGGVHKGFAPPGPSAASEVDEEESINYELGVNAVRGSLRSELVAFYNDYENLLGADTAASGGTGSGDLFNAGEATVWGIEASVAYDLGEELGWAVKTPWYLNYTFTSAEFDSSFDTPLYGEVFSGDDIPYIAPNQLSTGIALDHEKARIGIDMYYVDAMPAAAGEAGVRGAPNTDAHVVFDLEAAYKLKDDKARIFFLIENLFDEEYIAAIRPAGARPGLPRTFLAGVKFSL